MKLGFFPKLALDGIRKNKRLYFPYLLTCSGMVMMFYIIHYLAAMPLLKEMAGGRTTMEMLGMGTWIVILFAFLFLFYTNSFLMRRRQMEFGLYNILGMGKGSLSLVLLWETVFLFALSMTVGLLGGIALSKLAELGLMRVIHGKITYDFTVNREALADTFTIFSPIFLLIYLKNLVRIWRLSAVSLLKSENAGEKPPRANYLLGLAGIGLLGAAYYIAVTIQSPLSALGWFFIAVGIVILATYLLFISGSVMLCRLLQKKKSYYYQKQHFVSVSSMAYRMKRNGAGLASICILSTMVLVMLLGSGSLYFGSEDSLHSRYPKDITAAANYLSGDPNKGYTEERREKLMGQIQTIIASFGVEPRNEEAYVSAAVVGLLRDGKLELNPEEAENALFNQMDEVCNLCFIPLSDYNRCMGTEETLEENQVLIYCVRRRYDEPVIALNDSTVWQVKKQVPQIMGSSNAAMNVIPTVFLVVPRLETVVEAVNGELSSFLESVEPCRQELSFGFDVDLPAFQEIALHDAIRQLLEDMNHSEEYGFDSFWVESREKESSDFYGTFGGLFYLGIILSIVFLLATVLIIYYKQISEGYEDQGRFEIMQKVGMSKTDIRKSVNSQMLTVFFLPLVTAAVHLCFAFPMVQKLLMLFSLRNTGLMLIVMAVTVLVFGGLYALIYKLTANAYLSIVSGGRE